MTYYKFKAREGIVDWGTIGENLSEGLNKVNQERQTKKAEIDNNLRTMTKTLSEAPYGENITANGFVMDFANQGSQHLLALNKALKSGNMSLADYTSQTNSIMDGSNSLYNIIQGYNKEYERYMDLAAKGESSGLMDYVMQELDSYTNFGKSGAIISPIDGTVVMTKKLEDGSLSTNPKDFLSTQSLEKRIKSDFPKMNVAGSVESVTKALAKQFEVQGANGIAVLNDIRSNPNFKQAKEGYVKSMVPTPYTAASVLLDYLGQNPATGKDFYLTSDINDKNPNAVYAKNGNSGLPEPVLTNKQQQQVFDYLESALDSALDREIELKKPATTSRSGSGGGGSGGGSDWNKGVVEVNDNLEWVLPTSEGKTTTKNITVEKKADILAASTRADKSSSVSLTVPAQVSGGVRIENPTPAKVNVQSYFRAKGGGWYALGDIQKDVKKVVDGQEVSAVESVNVIIPLKEGDYNALDAHYDDGTFVFSQWLATQGGGRTKVTAPDTGSTTTPNTSKYNKQ